jgi:ABC-type transport system involved in multi-copper enzyme maturation permease subunit
MGTLLCLVQLLAAAPWLAVLDSKTFWSAVRRPATWGMALGVVLALGVGLGMFIAIVQDPARLIIWGRVYGAVLHGQLTVDFFILLFPLLMLVWPHGGAVALSAFLAGVRQPLFWVLVIIQTVAMILTPFFPYFTFGEDYKMVREIGYDLIMLMAVAFGVFTASISISEEIEGRSAITVMSKPVSRRQFLVGKFLGILAAALLMTGMLGWFFNGVLWFKLWFDRELPGDPAWLDPLRQAWRGMMGDPAANFILGGGVWFTNAVEAMPGLIFGFCQAMVLLSIAVALATRLPMIVNVVTCLLVFFLGHLTHVLVQVSQARFALVNFMARFFDTILPGLEYFDPGPLIVRDIPLDPKPFSIYIGSVVLYAVVYSVIVLIFGLILFEDRDLA